MKKIPWWLVIVLLFMCPVVGIILLIVKLKNESQRERAKRSKSGLIALAVAGFFTFVTVVGARDFDEQDFATFGCLIAVFGIIGVVRFVTYKKRAQRSLMYDKYLTVASQSQQTSLSTIASTCGVSVAECKRDLNEMMAKGYFKGCYVDEGRQMFVTPSNESAQSIFDSVFKAQRKNHKRVIKCPNCGAVTVVYDDETAICEYCDSPLE